MDWNPVIHVLDELRDGPRSLLEFTNAISRYDRASSVQNLLYLADRELIKLSAAKYPFEPIPKVEWQGRLRGAFGSSNPDPVAMANTSIDLAEKGEKILQLIGIGYP